MDGGEARQLTSISTEADGVENVGSEKRYAAVYFSGLSRMR